MDLKVFVSKNHKSADAAFSSVFLFFYPLNRKNKNGIPEQDSGQPIVVPGRPLRRSVQPIKMQLSTSHCWEQDEN